MLILFVSMVIMLSTSSLIFVNIVVNYYPESPGSHEFDVDLYLLPYLAFNIIGHNYELHHHGGSNGAYVHVNMNDQSAMI
jgi:hypothetical protein